MTSTGYEIHITKVKNAVGMHCMKGSVMDPE